MPDAIDAILAGNTAAPAGATPDPGSLDDLLGSSAGPAKPLTEPSSLDELLGHAPSVGGVTGSLKAAYEEGAAAVPTGLKTVGGVVSAARVPAKALGEASSRFAGGVAEGVTEGLSKTFPNLPPEVSAAAGEVAGFIPSAVGTVASGAIDPATYAIGGAGKMLNPVLKVAGAAAGAVGRKFPALARPVVQPKPPAPTPAFVEGSHPGGNTPAAIAVRNELDAPKPVPASTIMAEPPQATATRARAEFANPQPPAPVEPTVRPPAPAPAPLPATAEFPAGPGAIEPTVARPGSALDVSDYAPARREPPLSPEAEFGPVPAEQPSPLPRYERLPEAKGTLMPEVEFNGLPPATKAAVEPIRREILSDPAGPPGPGTTAAGKVERGIPNDLLNTVKSGGKVSESGVTRILPQQLGDAISSIDPSKVKAQRYVGTGQPQQYLKDVGLAPVGDTLLWGERGYNRMTRHGENALAAAYRKHGVKTLSNEEYLLADVLDGKTNPANPKYDPKILEQAKADGVNVGAVEALAEELRPTIQAFGHLGGLPQERFLSDYLPHMWEGVKPDDLSPELFMLKERHNNLGARSAYLEKSRSGAEGYSNQTYEVLSAYFRSVARDAYLDRPLREIGGKIGYMKGLPTQTRESVLDMLKQVANGSKDADKRWGGAVAGMSKMAAMAARGLTGDSRLSRGASSFAALPDNVQFSRALSAFKSLNAWRYLSLNLRTPINIMADMVPAIKDLGLKWTEVGRKQFMQAVAGGKSRAGSVLRKVGTSGDEQLAASWEASGLPALSQSRIGHMEGGRALRSKIGEGAMYLVESADVLTKGITYFGARARHLASHPGDLLGADLAGARAVETAQPLFLRSTTPRVLQGPVARATFQFTQPAFKVASQQKGLVGNALTEGERAQVAQYLGAAAVFSGAGAIVGVPIYRNFAPIVYDPEGKDMPLIGKVRPGSLGVGKPTGVGQIAMGLTQMNSDIGPRMVGAGLAETARLPIPGPVTSLASAAGLKGTGVGTLLGAREQAPTLYGRIKQAAGFSGR